MQNISSENLLSLKITTFNPGLALTGFRTTRLWSTFTLYLNFWCCPVSISQTQLRQTLPVSVLQTMTMGSFLSSLFRAGSDSLNRKPLFLFFRSFFFSSYGYRGRDCRNNLFVLSSGELIYFTAAVVVLYDVASHKQRHYTQHTDDIKR